MITIDGSQGEGGGQILRTALALSLVTERAFRIEKIRARRKKPGLLRQHLTAVKAAARVGDASVIGAEPGSTKLTFKPGKTRGGEYAFSVGTAGSATLVLQTVLPALVLARDPSTLVLEGGTHNPLAPPFDFLVKTFLPALNRMGPAVSAKLDRPGFYPAGGGRFRVNIQPANELQPLGLMARGEVQAKRGRILLAHLPNEIGVRQARMLRDKLNWPDEEIAVERVDHSAGPGNAIIAEVTTDSLTEVFAGFGERRVPSGRVVGGLVEAVREYLASPAPVGEHLADQLMLPLALAGGGCFRAVKASLHARTNKLIIEKFLPVKFEIFESQNEGTLFSVRTRA